MNTLKFKVSGIDTLLMNNPQMVDPFNPYKKAQSKLTGRKKKTEEDLLAIRDNEIEAKLYFDDDIGIYVPATWVAASIAAVSFARAKISKANIRSTVMTVGNKYKLHYDGMELVKGKADIVKNTKFNTVKLLKQGQVKVAKAMPEFSKWWFEAEIEYDPEFLDDDTLKGLVEHAAMYGGFGDFRPTHGRATVDFI